MEIVWPGLEMLPCRHDGCERRFPSEYGRKAHESRVHTHTNWSTRRARKTAAPTSDLQPGEHEYVRRRLAYTVTALAKELGRPEPMVVNAAMVLATHRFSGKAGG
jgi:hypothetical protein